MNTVEGFFVESGLFLKCPHCKNRTRQNVQSFFLSIHMNKPVTCTKCEKEFTIHVELRPFVEAVEHGVQADSAFAVTNSGGVATNATSPKVEVRHFSPSR